jgi:hypothetical protein
MKLRGRHRWGSEHSTAGIGRAAVLGTLIGLLLAGSVAMVSAARTLDIAPKVGDILVFKHGARMPDDWDFTVTTSSAVACVLTPAAMASEGGSLVVEGRLDNGRIYHVHWAGGRTSNGPTDCGRNTDLVMNREEVQLLSNAVGGPGVELGVFGYF